MNMTNDELLSERAALEKKLFSVGLTPVEEVRLEWLDAEARRIFLDEAGPHKTDENP